MHSNRCIMFGSVYQETWEQEKGRRSEGKVEVLELIRCRGCLLGEERRAEYHWRRSRVLAWQGVWSSPDKGHTDVKLGGPRIHILTV